ncbi:MAG: hypothetical protein UV73_C0003G0132 [Candidatus Gottesmanbacteria bacterium GW2011_GWA2_43_14]|uniref:Uncharacterized protein n=1 Tax=Candidatus Gottesmanbacteria bacterium GW2011_GWA2_43_14 TaxID=1618443 RepID=A0A0G1DK23_9BACT|nr:MAG: hypothetical protein UV73_C0003G0132 [Candidatus Gottesmanbacteria bacterium GW2011_GWA2_43_14]
MPDGSQMKIVYLLAAFIGSLLLYLLYLILFTPNGILT